MPGAHLHTMPPQRHLHGGVMMPQLVGDLSHSQAGGVQLYGLLNLSFGQRPTAGLDTVLPEQLPDAGPLQAVVGGQLGERGSVPVALQ